MKNNFLKVVLLVLLVTTVLIVASCQRTEEALAGLATKSKAPACVGRDCPAMDVIKAEYAKMGLSEKQMYQDMLYSNTLLYDGKQDYFLLYDLNTINDKKASPKVKEEAKANVYKKVNKMYSQFSGKSLRDTSWLISNEKYLKSMMFDKLSLSDSNKLLDPKDLQELLAQTGECMEKQKQQGDVVGGAKEEGKEGAEKEEGKEGAAGADKGGAKGAAGTGGISGACNTFGGSGMLGGGLGMGESASIIDCMEKYNAGKGQAGSMGMPGGGKGGSTGGGGTNPGPGMTGSAVAGSKSAPITTTGGDGGEGAQTGRLSGSGSCFGLDMGKMGGFAGQEGAGENPPVEPTKTSDGARLEEKSKDGKTKVTEYNINENQFKQGLPGQGPGYDIKKTVITKEPGQVPIVNDMGIVKSVPPGKNSGKDAIDSVVEKVGKDIEKAKVSGNTIQNIKADLLTAESFEEEGYKVNWNKLYNPESDSGTPCGADAAGLASCVMGSQGGTAQEQYNKIAEECTIPTKHSCSMSCTPHTGGQTCTTTCTGSGGEKIVSGPCGAVSQCLLHGGSKEKLGGKGTTGKEIGGGKGIKDYGPGTEGGRCATAANQALGTIMANLVIDPLPMNLMFSSIILQEAGIKAEGISGIGFEKGIEGLEKVAGSGAAKQGRAAAEGAGGCIGAGCK